MSVMHALTVDLPYPHKILWPNGRTLSTRLKAKLTRKHREWAFTATWAALGRNKAEFPSGKIPVHVHATRKSSGPYPDSDNTVAALKAYLDGIAQKLGINDVLFATPTVSFGKEITARFVITVGVRL